MFRQEKYTQLKKKLNAIDQDVSQKQSDLAKLKKSQLIRSEKNSSTAPKTKVETPKPQPQPRVIDKSESQKNSVTQKDDGSFSAKIPEWKPIEENQNKDIKNTNEPKKSFKKNQEAKGSGSCDMCNIF